MGGGSLLAFSAITSGVGGPLLLIGSAFRDVEMMPSPTAWAYIALAAILPQIIGHSAITWSLRYSTPTLVGIATLAEPLRSTLLAMAVFGELPSPLVATGCALTVLGIAIAVKSVIINADPPTTSPGRA